MATSKQPSHLTRTELTFWKAAFLGAPFAPPLKGKETSPEGAAQLAREYASAAVRELRDIQRRSI